MSDALTDMARDERRSWAYADYIKTLADFVFTPDSEHIKAIEDAAAKTDGVPRGYFGNRTKIAASVAELAAKLRTGQHESWAWLLHQASEVALGTYLKLRPVSPWPDKRLAFVSYQRFEKGLREILPMEAAGNGTTFSGNPSGYFDYVVFYNQDSTLLQIAQSAVCVGVNIDSYYPSSSGRTYLKPTSHRLEYLKGREEMFG